MFTTPPRKVTTRKQHREFERKQIQMASTSAGDHADATLKIPVLGTDSLIPSKDLERMKKEAVRISAPFTSVKNGSVMSRKSKRSKSSSIARRKYLELEAAEAKARIQLALIDKKLEADLAQVDAEELQGDGSEASRNEILDE